MEELNKEYKESTISLQHVKTNEKADKFNAAHYSTGAVAASFTSTTMVPELTHEPAIIQEDLVRYERVKKKGKMMFLFTIKICMYILILYRICAFNYKFWAIEFRVVL